MRLLRYFALGLWFSLAFVVVMILGNAIAPNALADTAFTDLGILSVFVVVTLDTIFNLGSAEDQYK